MDLQWGQRQRRILFTNVHFSPCLWGMKFTDHFPSVVNGVKFPIQQEPPVCCGYAVNRDPGS